MEYYYAYHHHGNSGSNLSSKEKRPPLKRGQLKRQIVRTISNLVVPRSAAAGFVLKGCLTSAELVK
uniref:Uncharacterized protein n=1 Tax=Setaria viridis TaxID=4556 RepID=A0A4U6VFS9_SETVI|nr:hypothetical protein SEVIR_3G217400v2 [Setaria viridis]